MRASSDAERQPRAQLSRAAAETIIAITASEELRFSSDAEPGIARRRAGSGFYYVLPDGRRVTDEATLARIRKLAVPPAYRDVWICRDANGHLQATGIDARGRKQYRYHERWRRVRDAHKFERMMAFGRALPRIHRRLSRDLKLAGVPREKVLATIVRLLESTLIRVGNDEYARTNRSYGLTTMRTNHVKVKGERVRFSFRGKHGIRHEVEVQAPRCARVLRKCLELPGQELFGYVDADGNVRDITSTDVNRYLKEISGEEFTAKDFRTWYGTSAVLESLAGEAFATARESKEKLKAALQVVAQRLGNTPTMCRKCYVHPVVVDAFLAGELREVRVNGGGQRLRLLHLLACTPKGIGFKRPSRRRRAGTRTAERRVRRAASRRATH
ncbi:MAG TPA: DNA topoisomerase IB [Burkholderiales bacterium]|nr:DNA topoisomerase IB [Burkholderiales bacterium]